ncbi:helix-turn-helix domain-containing protein [Tenacibaculum ovolyticum]|uniref:helix-turn-helix domain-containing protein n=1 Tax=Tenacibaculum ovolyticum TaxID=104270 RepID=UPI003BAB7F5F
MSIVNKITELRKAINWSQADLAGKLEVSRVIVGKYERNETSPSVDIAKKITNAFEVSLDFLVGDGKDAHYNKKTLQIIEDIEELEPTTKDKLYFLINAIIRDSKTRKTYL